MWEQLKRDPVLRAGAVVTVAAVALSLAFLPPPAWESFERLYSDTPFIVLCLVAIQYRLRELPRPAERRFWDLWTVGLCCWLLVKLLDAFVPPSRLSLVDVELVRSAGFLGYYACVVAALEVRPHLAGTSAGSRRLPLAALGTSVLTLGLYIYFALLPAALVEGFRLRVPAVLLYVAFDVWILSRLATLYAGAPAGGPWRAVYGGLLVASAFWFGADVAEVMMSSGAITHRAGERLLDLFWLPPFVALSLAARSRHLPWDRRAPREAPPGRGGVLGPLVAQAAALPLLHLTLFASGSLAPATQGPRAVCALAIGLLLTVLAVVHDRRIERDLVEARDAAESASRAKTQFLANVSHELRTPLSGVLGATDLLLDAPLPERERRLTEVLRLSAESLLTDIDEILDFSRIESGRLQLESQPVSPGQLVEETAELLSEPARRKGIEMIADVEPGVPEAILGDRSRIRQVLVNLAGNAIKFTDHGTVVVRAALESRPGHAGQPAGRLTEGETIRFEVEDTGIGISEEAGGRLFEPFQQGDGSTTRRFGGTGLGLAICRRLALLMGGELDFVSRPGAGTTFVLRLPLVDASSPGSGDRSAPATNVRILVVAPSPPLLTSLSRQLVRLGIAPEEAGSLEEAAVRLGAAARLSEPFQALVVDDRSLRPAARWLPDVRSDARLQGLKVILLAPLGAGRSTLEQADAVVERPVGRDRLRTALASVLPGAFPEPTSPASPEKAAAASVPTRGDPSPQRVLLVEDDAVNQEVTAELVRSLGLRVELAADGIEALRALEKGRFDLVLMDCMMPALDGHAAAAEIRRREAAAGTAHVPIVALTAAATVEDRERALESGMDAYLAKPVRRHELSATLGRFLGGRSSDARSSSARQRAVLDVSVLEELEALSPDSPSPVGRRVVGIFRKDSVVRLAELEAAVASDDAAALKRAAHALKSSSAQVGGTRLSALCRDLEALAAGVSGDPRGLAGARAAVEEIHEEHARLLAELDRYEARVGAEAAIASGI